jgi:hypothetical protein
MPDQDRRAAAEALSTLEALIERMEALGRDAEDAAVRLTTAFKKAPVSAQKADQQQIAEAIGDVIEIVSERSKLAHQAHRVITELRRSETDQRRRSRE